MQHTRTHTKNYFVASATGGGHAGLPHPTASPASEGSSGTTRSTACLSVFICRPQNQSADDQRAQFVKTATLKLPMELGRLVAIVDLAQH